MLRISPRQFKSEYLKKVFNNYENHLDKDLYSQNRFESKFKTLFDYKDAVAVNSGTTALHLSLAALGVGYGDEVVCPSFSFVAVSNSVKYLGAKPIFVDIDLRSFSLSPFYLKKALEERAGSNNLPKAIIVVHPYGYVANIASIAPIAEKYGIPIIEDAAAALGSSSKNINIGKIGIATTYSFNLNKIVSTGGGGIVASNNTEILDRIRHLSSQAKLSGWGYVHDDVGYNTIMHPLAAEIGTLALNDLKSEMIKRKKIFDRYLNELSNILNFIDFNHLDSPNHWLTPVYHNFDRLNEVKELFDSLDIEFKSLWNSLNVFDFNKECLYFGNNESLYLYERGFVLPGNALIEESKITTLIEGLKNIYE